VVFITTDALFGCSKEGTVTHTTLRTCRCQSFCLHFTSVADFWRLFHFKETVSKLRSSLKSQNMSLYT